MLETRFTPFRHPAIWQIGHTQTARGHMLPATPAAADDPKHPAEHVSIIFPRPAPHPCRFRQQQFFYALPLFFCQFIPFHSSIFVLTRNLCSIFFKQGQVLTVCIFSAPADGTRIRENGRERPDKNRDGQSSAAVHAGLRVPERSNGLVI